MILNVGLSILAFMVMVIEIRLIIIRNHKIVIRGADDFFSFVLVLLFAVIVFPLNAGSSLSSAFRNTIVLLVILFSVAVKRGVAEEGIMKLGFCIPWENLIRVTMDEYPGTKIEVFFYTSNRRYMLLFQKSTLERLVALLEKRIAREKIMISKNLQL